jgi:hypothetical protein
VRVPFSAAVEILITIVADLVGDVVCDLVPGRPRRFRAARVVPAAAREPFLEGLLLAVALDGRIDPSELDEVRRRAERLAPGKDLDAMIERASAAIAGIRGDAEALKRFRAIAVRLPVNVHPVLLEAVAVLSLLDAQGRPDVPYLCAAAMGVSAGETDRILERAAKRHPPAAS